MPSSLMAHDTQSLFPAIESGDLEHMTAILDADPGLVHARHADPDLHHWGTLQFAAARGQLDACRLLVGRGAEVYTNPMNTYPPVMQAQWNGHDDVVAYFLEEIPDKAEGTNGLGVALNLAAREGWTDLVRRHLELDPLNVHQRGWIGDTPLHWPCHNGRVEIVELLLDAGADIEADEINCYGGKPLHWASEHAPGCVQLLIKRGAKVDSRNEKKDSDLHGMTPLIMNASQHHDCAEVACLLLEAGANREAVDAKGSTALDHARENENKEILAVLEG